MSPPRNLPKPVPQQDRTAQIIAEGRQAAVRLLKRKAEAQQAEATAWVRKKLGLKD